MKKTDPFIIVFKYKHSELEVGVVPVIKNQCDSANTFNITINEKDSGLLICLENKWIATDIDDLYLVDILGAHISAICNNLENFIGAENVSAICLN